MVITKIKSEDLAFLIEEAKALKTASVLDSTGYFAILTVESADWQKADIAIDIFKQEKDNKENYYGIYISANDDTPFVKLNNKTLEDVLPMDITDYTETLDSNELIRCINQICTACIKAIQTKALPTIV